MNDIELKILKKTAQSKEGLISPAIMINSYADGDRMAVENLVARGYLQRIQEIHEGIRNGSYSINFYAVTAKGIAEISSPWEKFKFRFKENLALWVGIFSILFGLITLGITIYQHSIFNRPYLGLSDLISLEKGAVYASTTSNGIRIEPGMQIGLNLKNYGNRPAHFTIQVDKWPGQVRQFQSGQNFIMPNQEIPFFWNLMFPDKVSADSLCSISESIEIRVAYGSTFKKHSLIIRPKFIDTPSASAEEHFKVVRYGCPEDLKQGKVRVWYIENLD